MGLSSSLSRMSGSEGEESAGDSSPRYNLRPRASSGGAGQSEGGASAAAAAGGQGQRGDNDDEADLSSIVAYLIRSGQIRFINQGGGDSDDSDEYSDNEFVATVRPPKVEEDPDVDNLKKSDIYASVMRSSGRWADPRWLSGLQPTLPGLLTKRELGLGNRQHQFSHGDQCLIYSRFLPNKHESLCRYHHKAFCGSFSANGDVFLSACQDQYLRVYDTSQPDQFEKIRSVRARDVGWSVLDTAFSPDGRYAAYSSWSDCIHLCNIFGDHEIHESLPLSPGDHSFAIFSLMFSSDNTEILGGANDGHIYVYDREANKRSLKIDAHDDDINTVRFADASSHILYSGGDDGLCKVWDRRTLREERPRPVGCLAGHGDGITFIDSKGDARFFISNSKDQTLKLWDVRKFSDSSAVEETKRVVSSQRWDYRWQQVPKRVSRRRELRGDSSVMTYRGHCVLHTLIRCRFSPEASTGQRFIYTGCATGAVVIYDLLSGQVVGRLAQHRNCVRDVAWHPYRPAIISTSWDGSHGLWTHQDPALQEEEEASSRQAQEDEEESPRLLGRRRAPSPSPARPPTKLKGLFD